MRSIIESLKLRLFIFENGTAGVFSRSVLRSCIMPSSVASGEGLGALARRLCSKSDFEFSERKPRWMLAFSFKPSKRHFPNYDGS